MSNNICKHFYVTGKVQGVWFRANTQKEAIKLGVTGWVKNLPDGRVEVMVCGTGEQVSQMEAWLLHGPERACVQDLQAEETSCQQFAKFEII